MTIADALPVALQRWAGAHVADGALVDDVHPMPGNAGLSFGFRVTSDHVRQPYVIRLAPPGVRRRGNTDVLRQVPVIRAAAAAGVPVARVRWWTDDPGWFGTDAFIQDYLDARPLHMTEGEASVDVAEGGVLPLLRQGLQALAQLHSLDWQGQLSDWERPRSIDDEITFWSSLLHKAAEPAWAITGLEAADTLRRTAPHDSRIGLLHGDYHTNNLLFGAAGELVAVIDWEICGIGAQLIDLGWLSVFTDPSCWAADRAAALRVVADPEWLRAEYESASGRAVEHYQWYRGLAAFRFGAIAAFNTRLHRLGRRLDPLYEELAASVPVLFERARELAVGPEGAARH
jgi:aminoglycoside phosphotransferase (APT) family kinase protein